jgi:hypothetical protein
MIKALTVSINQERRGVKAVYIVLLRTVELTLFALRPEHLIYSIKATVVLLRRNNGVGLCSLRMYYN